MTAHHTTAIRKAVIPTSFAPGLLPATKVVPPELLPMAGIATIERIVAAASGVGITDVLLVLNGTNRVIEDHFDRDPELERCLVDLDDRAALVAIRRAAALATIHAIRLGHPLGHGDAVQLARPHVGDESFVVLSPDRLVAGDCALVADVADAHEGTGRSAVAVRADLDLRTVVAADLEWYGRAALSPEVFDVLDHTPRDEHGHRSLGDALLWLLHQRRLVLVRSTSERCDLGDRLDRLRTELALMLSDPTWADQVEEVLTTSLRAGARPGAEVHPSSGGRAQASGLVA